MHSKYSQRQSDYDSDSSNSCSESSVSSMYSENENSYSEENEERCSSPLIFHMEMDEKKTDTHASSSSTYALTSSGKTSRESNEFGELARVLDVQKTQILKNSKDKKSIEHIGFRKFGEVGLDLGEIDTLENPNSIYEHTFLNSKQMTGYIYSYKKPIYGNKKENSDNPEILKKLKTRFKN